MAFFTGQSRHVLKSLHTGEGPEQGFRHSFADKLITRSLFLAVVQASSNSFAGRNRKERRVQHGNLFLTWLVNWHET